MRSGSCIPDFAQKATFVFGQVLTTRSFSSSLRSPVILQARLARLKTQMLINTTFTVWEDRCSHLAEPETKPESCRAVVCLIKDLEVCEGLGTRGPWLVAFLDPSLGFKCLRPSFPPSPLNWKRRQKLSLPSLLNFPLK